MSSPVRIATAAVLAAALVATASPVAAPAATAPTGLAPTAAAAARDGAVIGRRKLGESVRGRPIMAYRLGERDEKTVVLFSTMHGDESRTRRILVSLRDHWFGGIRDAPR